MAKYISIAYTLTANAGSEGDVALYRVEDARVLRLTDVRVNFPSGQAFKLQLSLFRGVQQVAPYQGAYASDGGVVVDKADVVLQSGERLILHYKNTDTVNPQSAFVLVGGELE